MRAGIGDKVVVQARYVGASGHERSALVLAVEGPDGAPPYFVRWDDGHESRFTPGSDATVEHYPVLAAGHER